MSEIMTPMPFDRLMGWAIAEYREQGRIFGIRKEKFYSNAGGTTLEIFGERIASPIGPAAGPNSQLAQNIVAAFLAGSRFVELKTVQKMDGDELRACVPRPCINAEDEGYNVEWSTELTVQQAMEEYIKAWLAVHVLAAELELDGRCVFNMSVGYDLEGIKGDKVNGYIDGMRNAAETAVWKQSVAWLWENRALFTRLTEGEIDAIPARVSDSVTLSTLHGCPPQEIERIAKYLLEEKGVHTFVKCNPTLLGYEKARAILDRMGYTYISFDEHHFQNDLQYADAVAMLRRLQSCADGRRLAFGVKITNTFPVQIKRGELPGEEMYMSGRSLFPLSITVATMLAADFDGKLTISYSGGADYFNIADIFAAGIRPVTVATTILKPGGYERLRQLAETLEPIMKAPWQGVDPAAMKRLADSLPDREEYRKENRPAASRKTSLPLGLFDCFQAPCREGGCPIEQQIPTYLRLVAEERYDDAFRVIAVDNAVPSLTGTICNHACQSVCTRMDYESPLEIRGAKLLAADAAQEAYTAGLTPPTLRTGKRAVVIGAGPAGVSAALFLRRNGVAVTVLEKRDRPFGIVEYIIPGFRIGKDALDRDFAMAEKLGVEFRFGAEAPALEALREVYDFVVLAVGAWKECPPIVKEGQEKLLDALAFLEESKQADCKVPLGRRVAVIGGGDVAMDCARAAKRAPGVEKVTLVYRRTRDFMPADAEEVRLALEDGVELVELHAPLRYLDGKLHCEKMKLGDWEPGGRRSVLGTGEEVVLDFDNVISAVGARVEDSLFRAAGLELDGRGRPSLSAGCESSLPGVYVAGDCKAGPSTIVQAVADAKAAARDILGKLGLSHDFVRLPEPPALETLYDRKGVLKAACKGSADGGRCLACNTLCELCCDVCPNRANVRVPVPGMRDHAQILHIDGMCNECGNCGTFCPHDGNPYKDKLTLFWSEEGLRDSENRGFYPAGDGSYLIRTEDGQVKTVSQDGLPQEWKPFVAAVSKQYSYYMV